MKRARAYNYRRRRLTKGNPKVEARSSACRKLRMFLLAAVYTSQFLAVFSFTFEVPNGDLCPGSGSAAFVVIGIVHDRLPRNNQRGNLAPTESFERVPARPTRIIIAKYGSIGRYGLH